MKIKIAALLNIAGAIIIAGVLLAQGNGAFAAGSKMPRYRERPKWLIEHPEIKFFKHPDIKFFINRKR